MHRTGGHRPKRITQQQITGQQGVNFVERILLEMGFVWHPTNAGLEAGIDGIIEIRDPITGNATNSIIQVQVKTTSHLWVGENIAEFTYRCEERDIDYWMRGNTPVVLIAVRPQGNEAYWTNVKDAFADPERRREKCLRFDKETQRFDVSAASALMKLAVHRDQGPYMPAASHRETLISNLLEVRSFPPTIYIGSTDCRDAQEMFDWAREHHFQLPQGWLLSEKSLRSVYDLREQPWVEFVDRGSVEAFDIEEWAHSNDPDRQREFVRLMNQVLRDDMNLRCLRRSTKENCFYFPARHSDEHNPLPRRYRYKSLQLYTSREVVLIHRHPETNAIVYCRHNAMKCAFLKIEKQWCLAITPHYVYTTDGKVSYPYAEELLAGMKRIELQEAVLGQVVMWKYKLAMVRSPELFDQDDTRRPLISFDELLRTTCEQGLDDQSWLSTDTPVSEAEGDDDWELFDA